VRARDLEGRVPPPRPEQPYRGQRLAGKPPAPGQGREAAWSEAVHRGWARESHGLYPAPSASRAASPLDSATYGMTSSLERARISRFRASAVWRVVLAGHRGSRCGRGSR
jgi:hypothetical protein